MVDHSIKKVLIANRGEIALRIQRTCERLGIATVSIASAADSGALHAREAQELHVLCEQNPRAAYLDIPGIIAAARLTGCDSVHPGYGFLSENPDFSRAVSDAGLIFIGPSADSILALGNKTRARAGARAAGVPITPGSDGGLSDDELVKVAESIGYPIIIKAAAGGGGRGMRVAKSSVELTESLPRARAEAKKYFSDEAVFIEKYVEQPRHVEVQILGDSHGTILHFGTRDCSTQRRNQKLVEEAPAPNLSESLLDEIQSAAVRAAQSVGYTNAGTAEFLVKDDKFYFLEMNTRIQVEHPVTEAVTGVDLIELQIRVARGEKLAMSQKQVVIQGHAIEFRINAESAARSFAPGGGKLVGVEFASGEGIRVDAGYEAGDVVSSHFDNLIAKVIVSGRDRNEAIERSRAALARCRVTGVDTTIDFSAWLVTASPFVSAPLDIGYIEREFTAELLQGEREKGRRDPLFKSGVGNTEFVEWFEIPSKQYGDMCRVELIHRSDGMFVGIPTATNGSRSDFKYWRRSRSASAVLTGISQQVIEKISRADLWSSSKC